MRKQINTENIEKTKRKKCTSKTQKQKTTKSKT